MQVLHVLASASQRHQPNASDNRTAPFGAVLPLQGQNNRCVCVSCRRRHRCCSCHALLLHISLCCVFFGVVIATLLGFTSKLEGTPLNGSRAILAVHVFTNFLCNDRNVLKASERGSFLALVDCR
jgi:hypothetical protein